MCINKRLIILPLALIGLVLAAEVLPAAGTTSAIALQELNQWLAQPRAERPPLINTMFAQAPLSQADAAAVLTALWADRVAFIQTNRAPEMQAKEIDLDGLKMKFDWLSFGNTNAIPAGGRSLFISLHGGGGAPKKINDSQWINQILLGQAYCPAEGIYLAPRAPTDAWDMWHQTNVDDFIARLIEDFVVFDQVNPNRVYLLGYSAGGDGVYQLAPRMADRWAAASMMAGHPNDASPIGLRNVPFIIQVGAKDSAYHRNTVAVEWGKKLDALELADPSGYVHLAELHAGKGHWMDLEDRKAIPWMEKFMRTPLPEKIVWYQNEVTHTRSYWLARPAAEVKAGQLLVAERAGQVITLTSTNLNTVTVLLNDALLELDQPVVIRSCGQTLFSNRVTRTVARLAATLAERGDANLAFSAAVTVTLPAPETH
jgi:poly(3-hydroxybutyrate) depolymerase